MVFNLLSIICVSLIALGRQASVILKFYPGLWFFRFFERKRILFVLISFILLLAGFASETNNLLLLTNSIIFLILSSFSFFFDMKYFFPEIVSVTRVDPDSTAIENNIDVLGVKVHENHVAYGLNEILIPYHLIHDSIGKSDLLITYCAMCRSALAFNREVDGITLNFSVAGVWRRNMIIVDRETQSIWQQATGKCIYGPLKGNQLQLISSESTILNKWIEKHPDSKLVVNGENARRGFFSKKFMLKGLKFVPTKVLMPGLNDLSQLPVRETVFGIIYNDKVVAYPLSTLKGKSSFKDNFGGKEIKLSFDRDSNSLTAYASVTGDQIDVQKHWWLGWKEFYPETEVRNLE